MDGTWAGHLAEVHADVAIDPGVAAPSDTSSIELAIANAVLLALTQPVRPIPFGIQPILEVHLTLTTDQRIHQLNRDYRGQDKPTDVLSFSQVEGSQTFVPAPSGALALGDVVISVETAQRQAKGELIDELCLLAAHGALHLLGYDHETDQDEARMNALTQQALAVATRPIR